MVGVYLLLKSKKVVYVGQSVDIERRIKEHRADNKDFDDYSIVQCSKELLNTTEEAFILQHNPILNIRKAEITIISESSKKEKLRQYSKKVGMVKLVKEVKQKLKSISNDLDMPMSQVINMLINNWIKDNKG